VVRFKAALAWQFLHLGEYGLTVAIDLQGFEGFEIVDDRRIDASEDRRRVLTEPLGQPALGSGRLLSFMPKYHVSVATRPWARLS